MRSETVVMKSMKIATIPCACRDISTNIKPLITVPRSDGDGSAYGVAA
jgi:hypothetical protein